MYMWAGKAGAAGLVSCVLSGWVRATVGGRAVAVRTTERQRGQEEVEGVVEYLLFCNR